MILKPIGDVFALLSLFILVLIIVSTILAYQNDHFAKSEEFLKGVDNVTNVTWGAYPDGYYDKNGYPTNEELEEVLK